MPSLPVGGPLRLLAIAGSLALLSFLASALVLLLRRRPGAEAQARPGGARAQALWAAAPAGCSLVAFALGRVAPTLHPILSLLTGVVAARNLVRMRGLARALQGLGLFSWVIAILAARALFSR